MQIFKIDWEKIFYNISLYQEETHYFKKPVVLMNENTFNYLTKEFQNIINIKSFSPPTTICGCNIGTANWLDFGEIEIR